MANDASYRFEWTKFRLDWVGLQVRIEAGDLRLTHEDVILLRHANHYLLAMDSMADVPDLMREYTEKQMP